MPKRKDIQSILIIGAGPIVIGQACEFDYSGAQACKALREDGFRTILVNSNPATIMTDPELADATYIEPITPDFIERIIEKEKPDALLPTMGGQTALNAAIALDRSDVLKRHGVEMIGADADVIDKAEDRQRFREAMDKIGLESPRSAMIRTMDEAWAALKDVGLPAIIRPSFTLAGTGGGIAYNKAQFERIVSGGLAASPVGTVLIEESVLGWKEFEMEVVRDHADNCIIICSIENIDPMGVHTGDSITVAPAMTLTDKEYQIMRDASIACLREIGVDTGGSNVQFAVNPENGRLVVIEMNPRVSRSSALASKATGFPIAKVAAKLAVGYTLDELSNDITGVTPAAFEPSIDYVVVKAPRFTFEKFPGAERMLTTSMKSVGEAMAIGRCFQEALQKALRSLEIGLSGLDETPIPGLEDAPHDAEITSDQRQTITAALAQPSPDRLLLVAEALRYGVSVDEVQAACRFDPWFLRQIEDIVHTERLVRSGGLPSNRDGLARLKRMGFSDARLAHLAGTKPQIVARRRREMKLHPVYKRIDTCAAEFASRTAYMYSAYEDDGLNPPECEAEPSDRRKIMILGGGPNRIGQGIEFDYCCCHAAYALKEAGFETIMVNCNPETVSTDYDTADRLYFEPLTDEDVIEIARREQSRGELVGVIVQFGGQTPLKLAEALATADIPILGTAVDAIDHAEDRERFQRLLAELNLKQPPNRTAMTEDEAERAAAEVGYPVVIRPSNVLGGRAMEICHDAQSLRGYMREAVRVSGGDPILIDGYLQDAIEVDVDALADSAPTPDEKAVYVAGVMEHIEEAGIHSGDSACSLPPYSLPADIVAEIHRQTAAMARALDVVGLMNVQFAVKDGVVYVLEVNPRASRTAPFVAKATGVPIARIGAQVMAGAKLAGYALGGSVTYGDRVAVKEAVFPFSRFAGVDTLLGPEMKSTGEVMGFDSDFSRAFAKSQIGAGASLPASGTAFLSVRNRDKTALTAIARDLADLGFALVATGGTQTALVEAGVDVQRVAKITEPGRNIVDMIKDGDIQFVVNTTEGAQAIKDSRSLRRAAIEMATPYYTTMAGARAAAQAIRALRDGALAVRPLQS